MPIIQHKDGQHDPIITKEFDVWQRLQPQQSEELLPFWKRFFSRSHHVQEELGGRFAEMDRAQKRLLENLYGLYSALEPVDQHELYVFRETVVLPLIREGEGLKAQLHGSDQATQVKAFTQYNQWVERAKRWISDYERLASQELCTMIKHEIVRGTIEKIVKDQQLINEYLSQALEQVTLSPSFVVSLQRRIKGRIAPQMHQLENLKDHLEHLQLGELKSWKTRVNNERQRLFESSLDVIDAALAEVSGILGDHQQKERDLIEQITAIEKLCPDILAQAASQLLSAQAKEELFASLLTLQREAYTLSLDLSLPEEGADRLQAVQHTLAQARQLLVE